MVAGKTAAGGPGRAPRPALSAQLREDIAGYLFIAPWLIGFLVFTAGPFITSFALSFLDTDMLSHFDFVGLGNYVKLANDNIWWTGLYNTSFLAILGLSTNMVLGLAVALLLNEKVVGIRLFRTIFYLPAVVSGVAVFLIWITIFDYHYGLLNTIIGLFGIPPQQWLTSERWVKPSMILMGWWGVGSGVLLYLAGLNAIPHELYEAAEIDGADRPRRFRYITLPMLSPTIFFVFLTGLIGSLQVFIGPLVMTGGGPNYASMTVVLFLYNNGFRYFKMGYASAVAWTLFLIIAGLSYMVFRS
ncbi:MAG TPA: sugar ABC transporter permease, partial [Chloroflexota bacterium]|nr:sugar ABC transporter permease [Chloroflexota bacterium]